LSGRSVVGGGDVALAVRKGNHDSGQDRRGRERRKRRKERGTMAADKLKEVLLSVSTHLTVLSEKNAPHTNFITKYPESRRETHFSQGILRKKQAHCSDSYSVVDDMERYVAKTCPLLIPIRLFACTEEFCSS